MANIFKGVVKLPSKEAFETLLEVGSLETPQGIIVYSPNDTIYYYPDNSEEEIANLKTEVANLKSEIPKITLTQIGENEYSLDID